MVDIDPRRAPQKSFHRIANYDHKSPQSNVFKRSIFIDLALNAGAFFAPRESAFFLAALFYLLQRAPGEDGASKFASFNVPSCISVLIAVLDEQPALPMAEISRARYGPDQNETTAQLLAVEHHVNFAAGKLRIRWHASR